MALEIIEKVQRDLDELTAYFVEAETSLTKALGHVTERAPGSPMVEYLTKVRDHVRIMATTTQQTSRDMLGASPKDA